MIGCGPVGLAVITMLKAQGVRTVVASDLSAGRRTLALACGADVAVDPRETSPYADGEQHGHLTSMAAKARLGLDTMDELARLPLGWHHVWRVANRFGVTAPKRPVVFECVGVPGVLEDIITSAPLSSRIVVAGICMTPDTIRPAMAINKEIDLRFVVGYSPRSSATPCTCSRMGRSTPPPSSPARSGWMASARPSRRWLSPTCTPRSSPTPPEPG